MRERLERFMLGRYGQDQLSRAMMLLSLVFIVLSMVFVRFWLVSSLLDAFGVAGIVLSYVRVFSRDLARRRSENQKFLRMTERLRARFSREKYYMEQRKTNHIYTCPGCGQKIRVPRGKGRIEIRCPKCQETFIKKS